MSDSDSLPPDGIEHRHIRRPWRLFRHANPASLILLGVLLAVACLGVLGGHPHPVRTIDDGRVSLTVTTPTRLRNGMFFETRILIEPRQPIGDVVLAVSPDLWRDITINSAIPAAEKEEFADGMIRMSFGPGEPGKPIAVKFDGQVNPPLVGANRGEVAVFDGERRLAAIPIETRVLP
jgi:hypothetical protein